MLSMHRSVRDLCFSGCEFLISGTSLYEQLRGAIWRGRGP